MSDEKRAAAVRALDEIKPGDPESSHCTADSILESFVRHVAPEVAEAYDRVAQREDGRWWFA